MKPTCRSCGKHLNVLTKDGQCAYCYKEETKKWPSEFSSGQGKNKK